MEQLLEKYASLIVKRGVQLRPGQTVVISADLKVAPLVEKITRVAYEQGARQVIQDWSYEETAALTYKYGDDDLFDQFPVWKKAYYEALEDMDYCIINITSNDPDGFVGVDPNRMMRSQKAAAKPLEAFRKSLMSDRIPWCIVGAATPKWAKKVFPNDDEQSAMTKLWKGIYDATRVSLDDPEAAWAQHQQALTARSSYLNEQNFVSLHFSNSLGTDLTVELVENHEWAGGSSTTPKGQTFIANMPTEEVFTLPKKEGIHGIVYSAMPLVFQSKLIDEFALTFEKGRVVKHVAKCGEDVLTSLLQVDNGSAMLGEVALVPYESPISLSNILYYNTLFDENASCHLALGEGYPCFKDADTIDEETMLCRGLNKSLIHVDFMIGTPDLKVVGLKENGEQITIIEDGKFVFER